MSSRSGIPDFLQPHRLWPTRILCPWDSPGKKTRVGLPCPPPGDLPNPGSPALEAESLPAELPGRLMVLWSYLFSAQTPPTLPSHCVCAVPAWWPPPPLCYLLELISSPFHWPPCPSTSIPGTVQGEAVLSALWSLWMGSLWITLETQ